MNRSPSACLYGVGVGPGDTGLLTLRAVDLLQRAKHVFVPRSSEKNGSLALEIAGSYLSDGATVNALLFPMTRSPADLRSHWLAAAKPVAALIGEGSDCLFLTLGDPMFFSTFIYLKNAVAKLVPSARFEIVPGISAGFAAAAAAGRPLAEGDQSVAFIPGERIGQIERLLQFFETIVVYKVGKRLPTIIGRLKSLGLDKQSVLAHRVGFADQEIIKDLSGPLGGQIGYFSTIIINRRGTDG